MSPTGEAARRISAAEKLRLDECAQEPIRTPGTIQSHGVLIGVDTDLRMITVVSENCAQVFGAPGDALLGTEISRRLPVPVLAAVREILDGSPVAANPIPVNVAGEQWDLIAHSDDDVVFLEFEPALGRMPASSPAVVFDAIHRLTVTDSPDALRAAAVREIRGLTGFDRVMIYHFHEDGHGEVVAEDCAEGMEPYFGLHFPASDIPVQARQLYITKLSRAIVSTERAPSALLVSAQSPVDAVDLSCAELRSVSPYHLQFMRNMAQASTLSLSLVRGGTLIGMITCAHRTEHRLPFLLRSGLEVLANQVALQLSSMEEIARLTDASHIRELRTELADGLLSTDDLLGGLLDGRVGIRDVVPADGAICSIDGEVRTQGRTPDVSEFEALLDASRTGRRDVIATDNVGTEHPELARAMPDVAGLLFIPLATGAYLAFFREEVISTVNWLGDLSQQNRPDTLSPRVSFSSWSQSVRGTSAPWATAAQDAIELGRDIDHALLRRVESQLAQMALRDPLTGLPNRRALHERLERQFDESPQVGSALLFVDLDHFKSVNDSMGHDIGDALLVEVARRLERSARAQDTVARWGGDEFIIVCRDASAAQGEQVAARVLTAIREPLTVREHRLTVSASVGMAVAAPGSSASEVLRRADEAMYRAKATGRDRASR